jgi:hypothetical protein
MRSGGGREKSETGWGGSQRNGAVAGWGYLDSEWVEVIYLDLNFSFDMGDIFIINYYFNKK